MTCPEVSVSSPPRILMSVVLPEPEGPMRATHSPDLTERCRSSRARSAPYFFPSDSITTWDAAGEVTLHLETRKRDGCLPAAAAGMHRQSKQESSASQLQDTQSGAGAPPGQRRPCRATSKVRFPQRRQAPHR